MEWELSPNPLNQDEEKLWNTAVLSTHTPEGLLNAVFFSNGKNFILRSGEEHRHLKIPQLQRNISPDEKVRYTYTENSSKNRSGGFNQLDVPHKVVHQYEDPRAGPRCHVFLLDLYLSKIPNQAKDQDIFYLRPLPSVPLKESLPWFTCAPVGKNTLSQITKKMCGEAKIDGNKTNHSLKAYATSKLFQAGIPVKVIQDRTGHKSLDGLRKYESISEQQKQEACRVLATCGSDQEIENMGARIPNSLPGPSHGNPNGISTV